MTIQKMGVAVLGTGWIASEHIKAFQKNPYTEVRGILSRNRARAEAKIAEHGLRDCRPATDLDELLKDESTRIVSIGTPHSKCRRRAAYPGRETDEPVAG